MYEKGRVVAKHYDASYEAKSDLVDKPFYIDLAKECGGPVLEIGCGTGRILLEIARAGVPIDGVDSSDEMLSILHQKLAQEPQAVQDLVHLHKADMRSFALGRKFRLATIPFRPMQHLYVVQDQCDALRSARSHLMPEGQLAFDVFFPDFDILFSDLGVERQDWQWQDPENPARTITRSFVRQRVNKLEQYYEGEFIFRVLESGSVVSEERAPLKMSYYTYPHLLALFESCGLRIVEEYGSFSKEPIGEGKEMIFILKAKQPRG